MSIPKSLPRLCLIEDDGIMGESLLHLLQLEGFEVTWCRTAADGATAIGAGRRLGLRGEKTVGD